VVDSLQDTRVGVARDAVLTPERILDAVSEQLERTGIAGLRLRDVADRLHVSVPSLYRFFEDREAMIAAAYVRDFALQTFLDLDELSTIFASAETQEDYEKALRRIIEHVFSDERRHGRWRKLAAMAATRHDPILTEQIGTVQAQFTARVAELYETVQRKGWITTSINPIAFAFAVQGLALGPLFADVASATEVTSEDFAEAFALFHRALTA
jgi:AcrR family transcriptional regulator